jgi:murein DD-endopeptidase MepM/ murein hydrolase activator NlpD
MGRFVYDPENLKYEQIDKNLKSKFLRILSWVGSSMIIGLLIVVIYSFLFDTPRERELRQENISLSEDYRFLSEKYSRIDTVLQELQNIDENIYRTIFEVEPVAGETQRKSGLQNYLDLVKHSNKEIVDITKNGLDELIQKVQLSSTEYFYLKDNVQKKSDILGSIPAIQPIKNADLSRLASGFGNRLHPFYKIVKFHEGMDFTAPTGTEIYATGAGVVKEINRTRRGKGNTIVLDHGNGYESLYSHLESFKVRQGQSVKRGDVIGTVGNTGLSV